MQVVVKITIIFIFTVSRTYHQSRLNARLIILQDKWTLTKSHVKSMQVESEQ